MSRNILKAFGKHRLEGGRWVGDDGTALLDAAPDHADFTGRQSVRVIFADLDRALLEWIEPFDAVFGCVAWLSHPGVLAAINAKPFSQIVMQKEARLRLPGEAYRRDAGFCMNSDMVGLAGLTACNDLLVDRYRLLGSAAKYRPVMHHKFLVGCMLSQTIQEAEAEARHDRDLASPWYTKCPENDAVEAERTAWIKDRQARWARVGLPGGDVLVANGADRLMKVSVWAGSFNMTKGSSLNLDSAIVMGAGPAAAYFLEWRDTFIHSERLDYESDRSAPTLTLSGPVAKTDEDDDTWEHDIKPGWALVWWTTHSEARSVEQSVKASWPDYLRKTFECRLRGRHTMDDLDGVPFDCGSRVTTVSGRVRCRPRRELEAYISSWFDHDGCSDLFNDWLNEVDDVMEGIRSDMIGMFVRESHVDLLPKIGVLSSLSGLHSAKLVWRQP